MNKQYIAKLCKVDIGTFWEPNIQLPFNTLVHRHTYHARTILWFKMEAPKNSTSCFWCCSSNQHNCHASAEFCTSISHFWALSLLAGSGSLYRRWMTWIRVNLINTVDCWPVCISQVHRCIVFYSHTQFTNTFKGLANVR